MSIPTVQQEATNVLNESVQNIDETSTSESQTTTITLENVLAASDRIHQYDHDEEENLTLFSYSKCDQTDSELVKQCRGIVFHGDQLVMQGFPYTVEFSVLDDLGVINHDIEPVFDQCRFFNSREGTLIRIFYHNKWFISTHRKLDAFRSKWSSRESFGQSFELALRAELNHNAELRNVIQNPDGNILEQFCNSLDRANKYMFLVLPNNENRIVSDAPERPTVLHVGTFVNGVLNLDVNVHIPHAEELKFTDMNEMMKYVENVNCRRSQGVIVFTSNNKQYKIVNHEYLSLFRIRGNVPSIRFRYLQLRMFPEKVHWLRKLYPHMRDTFEEVENMLMCITRLLHNLYMQRHIEHIKTILPNEEYIVDSTCHKWHIANRQTNIVTVDKVYEVLNAQKPTNLNKMLRRLAESEQYMQNYMQQQVHEQQVHEQQERPQRRQQRREYIPQQDRPRQDRPQLQRQYRIQERRERD